MKKIIALSLIASSFASTSVFAANEGPSKASFSTLTVEEEVITGPEEPELPVDPGESEDGVLKISNVTDWNFGSFDYDAKEGHSAKEVKQINGGVEQSAYLVISDERAEEDMSAWSLRAEQTSNFTAINSDSEFSKATIDVAKPLITNNGVNETSAFTLSSDAGQKNVATQTSLNNDLSHKFTVLSFPEITLNLPKGLKLEQNTTYQADITWTLTAE